MKFFILACAVSACITGATPVIAQSSYGYHGSNTEMVSSMKEFCDMAHKDEAVLTGTLGKLCN